MMQWQHRITLFVFLYSGFFYIGSFLRPSAADWSSAMWLGLMMVSGTAFVVLPQEKR